MFTWFNATTHGLSKNTKYVERQQKSKPREIKTNWSKKSARRKSENGQL